MDENRTVILSCSSLADYVRAAQEKMGTGIKVIWLDERLHMDPAKMRDALISKLSELPEEVDTLLVSMGFCGGSWEGVKVPVRTVFPIASDCVSLLLHRESTKAPAFELKDPKHLYVKSKDPAAGSFKKLFYRLAESVDEERAAAYYEQWKESYSGVDVVNTGVYDCFAESYLAPAREDAAWLEADLSVVEGSNILLEKLFSGRWDENFRVFEAGEIVEKAAFSVSP